MILRDETRKGRFCREKEDETNRKLLPTSIALFFLFAIFIRLKLFSDLVAYYLICLINTFAHTQ
ncbi:hypothetical protein Hanom_Chr11g00977541 [Helianthus anomalus]